MQAPPTDAELEEFEHFASAYPEPEVLFERVRDSFGEYVPTRSCGPEILRRIENCVAEGREASFVRLGDGEGNLLGLGLDDYPALAAYCAREVSVMHFGAPDVLLTAGAELRRDFHLALRNSELIGLPGRWTLRFLLAMRPQRLDLRAIYGVGAVYAYLQRFADDLTLGEKTGSSSAFHQSLLPHYQMLIEDRDIGLVSCHRELVQGLQRRMGARSVDFYPVPKQAKIIDGDETDTDHYPRRYRVLLGELRRARPGIVYFVAAGMPGKVYCDAIRAAGGIAVDIGATADIWAGVRSRYWGQSKETFDTWQVV
jgi:hypothetical protein